MPPVARAAAPGLTSSLVDQVRAALTAARKNREADRTLLYSTLLSEFGNREIELGHALTDAEALEVVMRALKRRRESIEAYKKGDRTDLVDQETRELAALEKYLPPAVGAD